MFLEISKYNLLPFWKFQNIWSTGKGLWNIMHLKTIFGIILSYSFGNSIHRDVGSNYKYTNYLMNRYIQ